MNVAVAQAKLGPAATQAALSKLDAGGLKALDAQYRKDLENDVVVTLFRQKILDYQTTKRIKAAGTLLLWTTYRLKPRNGAIKRVQRYRYFGGEKSFDLTFTYEEDFSDSMISIIRQVRIQP